MISRVKARWARLAASFAVASVIFGATTLASAQSKVEVANVDSTSEHPNNFNRTWVSYADCIGDIELTFPTTVTGAALTDNLEIWVSNGALCSDSESRGGDATDCKRIYGVPLSEDATPDIVLKASEIAAGLPDVTGCEDATPTTSPRTADLWFMVMHGGDVEIDPADYVVWSETKVDLLGPKPPTDITVAAGEEQLVVTTDVPGDKADAKSYQVFCDLNGGGGVGVGGAGGGTTTTTAATTSSTAATTGAGGAGGAGVGGAGGAGGAGAVTAGGGSSTEDPSCTSPVLEAGERPDAGNACGEPSEDGTAYATLVGLDPTAPLVNGTSYVIGVAGVDDLGNVGELSELYCATPVPVDDFFETYRSAGGKGGGGFCAFARGSLRDALAMLVPLGLLGAGAVARRRRRRSAGGRA
jgi:hypothetical protein